MLGALAAPFLPRPSPEKIVMGLDPAFANGGESFQTRMKLNPEWVNAELWERSWGKETFIGFAPEKHIEHPDFPAPPTGRRFKPWSGPWSHAIEIPQYIPA